MAAVDVALVAGGALMGLAGAPHCAAMCGGVSAAAVARCGGHSRAFHAGRVAAYAAGGAVAASSVGAIAQWSAMAPALRPVWTMVQAAALVLGLWLLWTGRQPAWMAGSRVPTLSPALAARGWRPVTGPLRAGATGAAWIAWPCGLLQSALVAAGLASSAAGGALVMGVFAGVSSVGLWSAHRIFGRSDATWAVRAAGALLAAAACWALGHGLWARLAAYC